VNWQTTADGHHCTRHGEKFPRGEVCQACVTDPGEGVDVQVQTTEDVRQMRMRENEFRTRAKACWRKAEELLEGTPQDGSLGTKWSAESAKWERLALEVRAAIQPQVETDELLRKYRELLALDGPN
jgi:hypothetical protein